MTIMCKSFDLQKNVYYFSVFYILYKSYDKDEFLLIHLKKSFYLV